MTNRDVKKEWQDPVDSSLWVPAVGDAHVIFPGDGTIVAKGKSPRMTVLKSWSNVETTVYCKPLKGADGIDIRAKTDHYCVPGCSPDCFGGYANSFHYTDKRVTYKKEKTHTLGYTSRMGTKDLTLPLDKLVGYKVVIYNLANGHVKLETYIDLTEGANGGDWKKVNEIVDDGSAEWKWPPYTAATKGSAIRCNSLDSADGGTDYAEYLFTKWTIREITAS